jgi:hypothetical protein
VKSVFAFPAVAAMVAWTPARATAQGRVDPMADTVAQLLTMIEKEFVPLADAMPAEKYGFRPTGGEFKGVRSFGEQVKHVACANFAFYNEIEKKAPPEGCEAGGPSPAKTKDRAGDLPARIVCVCREGAEDDDAGQRDGTCRRTVRRSEHAAGDCDALDLARVGSLRPAGRLLAAQRNGAASIKIIGELWFASQPSRRDQAA